jgi:hypothetical protein
MDDDHHMLDGHQMVPAAKMEVSPRDGTPSSIGSSPEQDIGMEAEQEPAQPQKRKGGRKPVRRIQVVGHGRSGDLSVAMKLNWAISTTLTNRRRRSMQPPRSANKGIGKPKRRSANVEPSISNN